MSFGVGGERNLSGPWQEHHKWVKMSRNFCIGDIVLLKTDFMTQNHWPMCKVVGTNSDDKGVVRSVKLLLGNSGNKDDKYILERPITKIVLLLEAEDVDSPTKGALNYGQDAESLAGSQL